MGSTAVVGNNGARSIQFGIFEVDLRAGELRRNGSKVKLQEQPFQILTMLLARPGEVVTREELQKKLVAGRCLRRFRSQSECSHPPAARRARRLGGKSAVCGNRGPQRLPLPGSRKRRPCDGSSPARSSACYPPQALRHFP